MCFCDVKSELGAFIFSLLFFKDLFALYLLLKLLAHHLSLKRELFLSVVLFGVMRLQILQNNLVPLSFSHAVRLLSAFRLGLASSTFLRVLSLTLCQRLDRGVTSNRLSVVCLSFRNATSSSHSAANSLVESGKLILTYVCLHEDQLLHFVLNQSIQVSFRGRVHRVLVPELVDQELGELLALGLFLFVIVVELGLGLLRVHLDRAVITYLNRG